MSRRDFRKGPSLFEADQAELPFDAYSPPELRVAGWAGEQLALFEGRVPLVGEIEGALLDSDFVGARTAYGRLRESYPDDLSVSWFAFLSEIPVDLWAPTRSNEERLTVWEMVAPRFARGSRGFRAFRKGFLGRLLERAAASELAVVHPRMTADIANHLLDEDEWLAAREVVRDVLLSGKELRPLELEDTAVSELLGEEGTPEWLASLGAIRSLWPRQVPESRDIQCRLAASLPESDHERALDFWFCLCVSGLGTRVPENLRHDAHRRMKRLHPGLHEKFMTGRGVG